MASPLEIVIVTGMSGAGKTVAVQRLEDLDYFVIDNILPSLANRFVDVILESDKLTKLAMVMDVRTQDFYDEVMPALKMLRQREDTRVQLLFLDASDRQLVARYKETRRAHPLSNHDGVLPGIERERELLRPLKEHADVVIDTTSMSVQQLKSKLTDYFGHGTQNQFYIDVMSFGFKYGLPLDADLVFDARFIPNPFYIPELKHQTGNDQAVQDYVMQTPAAQAFYEHLKALIDVALPGYVAEGKTSLTIAIGCTGGQHRSVTLANRLGQALQSGEYPVNIRHRDLAKAH